MTVRREPSMPVADVAARFNLSIYRIYELSRSRRRRKALFQRLYISHARFEITMASIAAYEAHIDAINTQHQKAFHPVQPLNFRRGILA